MFEKVEALEIHFALHSLQAPSVGPQDPGWILKVGLELAKLEGGGGGCQQHACQLDRLMVGGF